MMSFCTTWLLRRDKNSPTSKSSNRWIRSSWMEFWMRSSSQPSSSMWSLKERWSCLVLYSDQVWRSSSITSRIQLHQPLTSIVCFWCWRSTKKINKFSGKDNLVPLITILIRFPCLFGQNSMNCSNFTWKAFKSPTPKPTRTLKKHRHQDYWLKDFQTLWLVCTSCTIISLIPRWLASE